MSTCDPARHQGGSSLSPQPLPIWTDVFPTSCQRQLQEPEPAPCQGTSGSITEARSLYRHLPGSPYLIRTPLGKQPKCIAAKSAPEPYPQSFMTTGSQAEVPPQRERCITLVAPKGPSTLLGQLKFAKLVVLHNCSTGKGMGKSWQICPLSLPCLEC